MAKITVTRTIHALPGKWEQYAEFLKRSDEVRRRWGMIENFVLQKAIDPRVIVLLQIWESEERYESWRRSPERAQILVEGRRLGVREPSLRYKVLEHST